LHGLMAGSGIGDAMTIGARWAARTIQAPGSIPPPRP